MDKRRRVNLLAQTADEGFDQFHAVLMFRSQTRSHNSVRLSTARFAHQHAQQREFSRRKLDPAQAAIRFLSARFKIKSLTWSLMGAFRENVAERTHSRDQFLHGERLREVIIRAEPEAVTRSLTSPRAVKIRTRVSIFAARKCRSTSKPSTLEHTSSTIRSTASLRFPRRSPRRGR